MRRSQRQSGQVMVLVAVALLAMIGSAALILLAGSVEWQKNQLQELADATALDSALKIGIGCDAAKANAVITEADKFLATRRTRSGALGVAAGTCATPYKGTDTFAGGLSATYNYPYRAHQRQVEVILTLSLPISFGGELPPRGRPAAVRFGASGDRHDAFVHRRAGQHRWRHRCPERHHDQRMRNLCARSSRCSVGYLLRPWRRPGLQGFANLGRRRRRLRGGTQQRIEQRHLLRRR